uniref:V-ATPase subunit E n=1 Tax=candidate division WOR-3 bacterium TaxID=2052148 RepID=A0A7V3NU24_UNCW3
MGLQEILNKIKEEADLKRREILDKAISERDRILQDADNRVKEILAKAQQEKEKLVIQRLNALIADYEIRSNVEIAKVKRDILKEIYGKVQRHILEDKGIYSEIVKRLFEIVELNGDEEIFVSENESVITKDFIEKLNKEKGWNLRISEKPVKISGGFIARGSHSTIDASIEKLMEILQEETEVHVSNILFF